MIELIIVVILTGNGASRASVLPPQTFETEKACRTARSEQMKDFKGKNVIMSCRQKKD